MIDNEVGCLKVWWATLDGEQRAAAKAAANVFGDALDDLVLICPTIEWGRDLVEWLRAQPE